MKDVDYDTPRYRLAGDRGLLVEYGDRIDLDINLKVRSMVILLDRFPPEGIVEVVPSYRSLLIIYEPLKTSPTTIQADLKNLEEQLTQIEIPPPQTVEIPVFYGGEFGPDLDFVAKSHDLTEDEVVAIHISVDYPIYMIGFTPGFPFLGGLSETLHTPRLASPRTHVPAGSVGIANNQTGIYPVASPGGWQLIGRTPITLFDPGRSNPFLYQAGDRLRFKPISSHDYHRLSNREAH